MRIRLGPFSISLDHDPRAAQEDGSEDVDARDEVENSFLARFAITFAVIAPAGGFGIAWWLDLHPDKDFYATSAQVLVAFLVAGVFALGTLFPRERAGQRRIGVVFTATGFIPITAGLAAALVGDAGSTGIGATGVVLGGFYGAFLIAAFAVVGPLSEVLLAEQRTDNPDP